MANVMILGSGGREDALAWWFGQYRHSVAVAPGNAGTHARGANINVPLDDFDAIAMAAVDRNVKLVVVGPEAPLVAGIADYWDSEGLTKRGIKLFGPKRKAAMLEGSKIFARTFARKYGIPVPEFFALEGGNHEVNVRQAESYLETKVSKGEAPLLVVKADGLCGGKGVFVEDSVEGAVRAAKRLGKFGKAGSDFLLEQRLTGPEVSVTVITDGHTFYAFHHSQDHKRRFDGDEGPNTGGMGAYAPTKVVTPNLERRIENDIIIPTLGGMKNERFDYKGMLYFAIMLHEGQPYLLEYNCRFGDPEAQAIIPMVKADPFRLMTDCLNGHFDRTPFALRDGCSACVVLCDESYPEGKSVGAKISFDVPLQYMQDVRVFHSGTKQDKGHTATNGGRILSVVAAGAQTHQGAFERVYEAISHINFKGKAYRNDIGYQVREV